MIHVLIYALIKSNSFNDWEATIGADEMEIDFGEKKTSIGLDGMAMVFNGS